MKLLRYFNHENIISILDVSSWLGNLAYFEQLRLLSLDNPRRLFKSKIAGHQISRRLDILPSTSLLNIDVRNLPSKL